MLELRHQWQKIIFLILPSLVIAILLGSLVVSRFFTRNTGNIAILRLTGSISSGSAAPLVPANINPQSVKEDLERIYLDKKIKAVVVRIDSGGGAVGSSQEIANMISSFQEKTGRPIVASIGDSALSGGYYIASAARKIVALPGSMVGGIGVIYINYDITQLKERLGIKEEIIKSGNYKDMLSGLRSFNSQEKHLMQDLADEVYNQFVTAVAKGRRLPRNKVRELATGQPFTGSQAIKVGLVDQLGDLGDAIRTAAKLAKVKDYKPFELKKERSLIKTLLGFSQWFNFQGFSSEHQLVQLFNLIQQKPLLLYY